MSNPFIPPKPGISFTIPELQKELKKELPYITFEEVEASVLLFEHLGMVERVSQDIWRTTGKGPPPA